jgi:hypothetical protein
MLVVSLTWPTHFVCFSLSVFATCLVRQNSRRRFDAHSVRLGFESVVLDYRDSATEWVTNPSGFLLNDVPQFVPEQFLALYCPRIVLAGREVDVRSPRIGYGSD